MGQIPELGAESYTIVSANSDLGGYTIQLKVGEQYWYPVKLMQTDSTLLAWPSANSAWAWLDRGNARKHPWWVMDANS